MPRRPPRRDTADLARVVTRTPMQIARMAIDAALDTVPGSVVERVTAATAPLTRYSGRTQAGALALASALAALAQPPRRRFRRGATRTLEDVASAVDEPLEIIEEWAEAGLLGDRNSDGSWPAAVTDRAMLLSFAARRGTSLEDLRRTVEEHRLPLLALEQVLAEDASLTARQTADRAGVPLELAIAVWQALGFPLEGVDERVFTRQDLAALRTMGALRSVFTDDDLVEAASVLGRAMSDIGTSSIELFRRRLGARLLESGINELEVALRQAALVELLVPPMGPLMEAVLRRHLFVGASADAAQHLEATGDSITERQLAVAFADMVGFTAVSEELTALQVSQLASRLLRAAETTLPAHGARLVKSIGDAVMFTAPDTVSCARAALDLIESAGAIDELPPVRAGIAYGPVLRAYADYFGRTVNLASRLCAAAVAGEVLVPEDEELPDAAAWSASGLAAGRHAALRLRGIKGRVPVVVIRRASTARAAKPVGEIR